MSPSPRSTSTISAFRCSVTASAASRPATQAPAPRLPGRGLYLSRTGAGASRIGNEPEVEDAARRAGLQVLHPQRLDLPLQIALMAETPAIAGTDGSALHLAAFARPGTRLLSLDTRDVVNQRIINTVAGLDARSVPVAPGGSVKGIDAHLASLIA